MSGEEAAVEKPQPLAVQEAEIVAVRKGMFPSGGAGFRSGGGDTSGYGRLERRIELPGQSPRPYGPGDSYGAFDEIENELFGALDEQGLAPELAIERVVVHRGQITFQVRREHLVQVARTLRDDPALRFELCLGVSGVHFPYETGRELHVLVPLMSITHNRRIHLETTCPDSDPHMPSLYSVYPAVDWHERETWDMFGIVFDGHPSLTRILMPDDWPGHPQRKDYPLGGIPVEFKGAQIPAPDQRRSYQ
ncbi:NADH-quinone oxidoreductase subunit C [Actinocrinis puniceicyclus]|uniref:NADH-quinone oxidoreductase subunit C n=1 Tax=Actinocrinis puniceicyclus TaxID=977794 RepID=A0A8J7WHG4_9ACTN|nr:NADH-quinone oxidoreductase subunit C [Actinocrinis puniceicyclus]MBS2962201.1 NADH-quinone oxidoreductase subunit C [Actinocrinis puniceicyclus]